METAMETAMPAVEAEAEEEEDNPQVANQAASRKQWKNVTSVLDQANKHQIMKQQQSSL